MRVLLGALLGLALARPSDDLVALERLVMAVHPAPTRYASAADLAAAFAQARAELDEQAEPGELVVGAAMLRCLALLGDAHVQVGLPLMQPGSPTPLSLLPLLPRTVEGAVLLDAHTLDLPPGTALVAVDGEPVAALLAELAGLVPADGGDPDARRRVLEQDLPRFYAFGRGMRETYVLDLVLPDGTPTRRAVPGVDRAGMRALRQGRHVPAWWGSPTPDGLPALERVDGRAVLRVPTLGVLDGAAFRARVDALFAQVDPAEPLVVDLRGNEGGLRPAGFAILDHLLAAPYTGWTEMRVAHRRIPRALARDVRWLFGSDRERLGRDFRPDGGGFLRPGDPLAGRARPVATPHRGPLALLVDGRTGSAANNLALVAKAHRPETRLVGEPLGGACDRHVGELPLLWTAPETGVTVLMSLVDIGHIAVPGCTPGRGLAPDVRVVPTRADFVAGRDPWLAAVP